ncbi:MAG: DUF2520 domain-containing protein [Bacteroidetes bacterium]|nr:DUF2520 domain-containing protein [Bacteroidota bacterium]MCL1968083.1 DUF2520 domain-containing protein [Bacteroidota bacterium]
MFTKIAIIGTGNVGTWLFKTIQNQSNMSVISISGRAMERLPSGFDLYIFALKDDVYETVLQQIPFKMPYAVHTSGSLSQHILAPFAEKYGVVYPYQTILREAVSGEKNLPVFRSSGLPVSEKVPICVEAFDPAFENALFLWAKSMFNVVYKITEKQRFAMHLAAVFACNFTNAMYQIAFQIFTKNNIDWSLILPLLENTLEKAKHNEPRTVQTGPAVRNDISIMEKHCTALQNEELKQLYQLVSKIIQQPLITNL